MEIINYFQWLSVVMASMLAGISFPAVISFMFQNFLPPLIPQPLHEAWAGWILALFVMGLLAALGCTITEKLQGKTAYISNTEFFLFGWLLGSWIGTILLFFLVITNAFTPSVLGILCVVFCIISKKYILEFLSSWINQFRHPPSIGKKETGSTVFIFLLIVIFIFIFYLPLLIQTLLPNTDWDAAIYHLPKAESLLHGMWRNNDPLLAHMSNPGGPNLFYAVFMAFGLETAVIPYNFLINLCIILCIFTFTKRFWGLRAACWGAAILATTPLFLKLGVDPRTDNFLAFYILLMVYALFIWLEKPQRSISLLFVAVGFSLALGVKYTALFFGGIVTLITLFMMLYYWRNGSFLHPVRWFFICTFIVIIPNSVWYINNFLAFRNPVYPIHSGLCYSTPDGQLRKLKKDLEPHLKRALTIPSVKKHNEVLNSVSIDLPKHIFNFYDIIKYPHRYNRKSNILFQPILLLGFLVPIFFYRNKRVLTLYGIGVIYYVVISYFSSGVLRYALPSI
ncbi:MAG: glycosyltransferase family 39 protein, partial [Candidatus Omnitrophica bacterium]|nr:glycosyltransferase family 39 protein [Candidatus Omnitrophota bacterium]